MEHELSKQKMLLSDEDNIFDQSYIERKLLAEKFSKLPIEFFSQLRHFQPQIGCLNACSICSKYAGCNVSFWKKQRIRNVIAALKYSSPKKEKPLIVWDRDNHINGVIFSYLDNDVGNYYYLDEFIKLAYLELGVKTRISTVGYSRHNKRLNKMHEEISKSFKYLNGVRLSFTPYEVGWVSKDNCKFSKLEYMEDMANFLKIYKPYYENAGSGARKFCVELRYKPLVVNDDVYILNHNGNFIICSGCYLYVSSNKNIQFISTEIVDPFIHRLSLNNKGEKFKRIKVSERFRSCDELLEFLKHDNFSVEEEVTVFKVKNRDGEYYSINPQLTDDGNKGINFYPKTNTREKSGFIITERFFLNELFKYKKDLGIMPKEKYEKAKWDDVDNVLDMIKSNAQKYKVQETYKYEYIINDLLPMLKTYRDALYKAEYSPAVFFDKNFTIDTGIICNLGRAIFEFKGLVSIENEPLTLNHERNYGAKNSTMTLENSAWRLSCGYNDSIIIEELNLSETATEKGQVSYKEIIKLDKCDDKFTYSDTDYDNLIPGQKEVLNGD